MDTDADRLELNQLGGSVERSAFVEYIRTGGFVTSVITWTTVGKTAKIREETITRAGGVVTSTVEKQYKADGSTVAQTLTSTYVRAAGKLASITQVES